MKVQRSLNNGNSTLRVVGSSILIERSWWSLEIFESRTSVFKKTKKEGIVSVSNYIQFSVQFSCSVVSNSLRPHELQHTRPPCPSPTPGVYSNSCPSSRWCHPAVSSSVVPFSSCPQSLPASGSFPIIQLFAWGGQSIGVSASVSVLPMIKSRLLEWLHSSALKIIELYT